MQIIPNTSQSPVLTITISNHVLHPHSPGAGVLAGAVLAVVEYAGWGQRQEYADGRECHEEGAGAGGHAGRNRSPYRLIGSGEAERDAEDVDDDVYEHLRGGESAEDWECWERWRQDRLSQFLVAGAAAGPKKSGSSAPECLMIA